MNQQIPDTEGISSSLPSKDTSQNRRPDSLTQTPELHQTTNCLSVPHPLTPHQQDSSTGSAAAVCCRLQRLGRGALMEAGFAGRQSLTQEQGPGQLAGTSHGYPQATCDSGSSCPGHWETTFPDMLNYTWAISDVSKSLIPLTRQKLTQKCFFLVWTLR